MEESRERRRITHRRASCFLFSWIKRAARHGKRRKSLFLCLSPLSATFFRKTWSESEKINEGKSLKTREREREKESERAGEKEIVQRSERPKLRIYIEKEKEKEREKVAAGCYGRGRM